MLVLKLEVETSHAEALRMKLSRTSLDGKLCVFPRHIGKTKNRGQPAGTPTNLYPLETVDYDDPQPDCSSMLNQESHILIDSHIHQLSFSYRGGGRAPR